MITATLTKVIRRLCKLQVCLGLLYLISPIYRVLVFTPVSPSADPSAHCGLTVINISEVSVSENI